MRASVVVPTYRRPAMLERCLAALAGQDFPRTEYEVIVADDGPDQATRAVVERWAERTAGAPAIRYVAVTGSQGPAAARNRGWEQAGGEIVAFTDDDTVARPDWLRQGWQAMAGGACAAAGRVVVPLPERAPTDREKDIARMSSAEFLTANCFVRRDALQAAGGFDERFTAAWREDSDLHFTLLKQHGTLATAPGAVVEHPVRDENGWSHVRGHRKILFDALLYKKHPEHYRERIRRAPPWNYYLIVAAIGAFFAAGAMGTPLVAWIALGVWLVLTAIFAGRRLEGTSRDPEHVAEVVLTSIAIPPVAVFWRLAGALRFRVPFL
jgi:GT2 family glycosyltransferase